MRPPRIRSLLILAAAGVLLSACRSSVAAPAAVVNGATITEGALEHQLDLLLSDPQFSQQVQGPGGPEAKKDLTRRLLAFLVERQLVEAYARQHDIQVPPSQINGTLSQVIRDQGGQAKFDRLLKQRGLTLEDVRENIRINLIQGRVQDDVAHKAFGLRVTQQQSQQAFSDWLRRAVRDADVEVNPRFGRFDTRQVTICPITSTADTASCPAA